MAPASRGAAVTGPRWSRAGSPLSPGVLARTGVTQPPTRPSRPTSLKSYPDVVVSSWQGWHPPAPSPPRRLAHILPPKFRFSILPLMPPGEQKRNPRPPLAGQGPDPGTSSPLGSWKGGGDGAEAPGDGDGDGDRMGALVFLPVVAAARRGRLRSRRCRSGLGPGGERWPAALAPAGTGAGNGRDGERKSVRGQPRCPPFQPLRQVSVTQDTD